MTDSNFILLIQDREVLAENWVRDIAEAKISAHAIHLPDGVEALKFLNDPATAAPGLIMLDFELPVADVRMVIHAVKSNPATTVIPIIALIADSVQRYVDEAYTLGADRYIVTPVDYEEFVRAMEALKTFWNDRATLVQPARPNPAALFPVAHDRAPADVLREFILLVQADELDARRHAVTIQEILLLALIKQVRNGGEALSFIFSASTARPRFILLDMTLPVADIDLFLAKMKIDPVMKLIPVIGLLPVATAEMIIDARNRGVDSWLMKPTDYVSHRVTMERLNFIWNNPDYPLP